MVSTSGGSTGVTVEQMQLRERWLAAVACRFGVARARDP
jgi:hypothetical protein